MAGYGYNTHGYSTYTTPPPSDDWTKSGYSLSDHMHRPSIIDDQGRKRPILSYETNPNTVPYYTTKTETVVQHQTLSPFSPEYNNQTLSPYSPEYNNKHTVHWTDEDYEGKYRKPLGPVNGGRPPMVDEYLTRVQNEASRARVGPWTNGASWRQDSNPGGYTEYNDLSNKEYLKSTGGTYRNDTSTEEYYRKQGSGMEPQVFSTSGGWARPTHSTWSTPPNTSLSKPTSNITEAVGILVKEAMKPAYGGTEAMKPAYGGTTGSNEPAKRYGNFNFIARKVLPKDYSETIDSREAARKYGGRTM